MGLVTVFWPLRTTGTAELVLQTGDVRFVVDCRVNPEALLGQVKIKLAREVLIVSCGCSGTAISRKTVAALDQPGPGICAIGENRK
jgi:hypothetical protein